jgi:hypothetical protein
MLAVIARATRVAVVSMGVFAASYGCGAFSGNRAVAHALSDAEFWALQSALGEPPGAFAHSDNLVSNEQLFPHTVRLLEGRGGVYVGVGPEQNFSFIARLRPDLAFIADIRQENRSLHLMYKALFELSPNRAEFVSRLFSRELPAGLGVQATVQQLLSAAGAAPQSDDRYLRTLRDIRHVLLDRHRLPLAPADLQWIDYAFTAFFLDGTNIRYNRSRESDTPAPTYFALMTATDIWGEARSYLATEEAFAFVKDLHARNLIVPVIGDFAGTKTIRAIGDYARQRGTSIAAFYGSNVEVYLNRAQSRAFCANLASLPFAGGASFISSKARMPMSSKLQGCPSR